MPMARYFIWVGSTLLILLFIVDACLPRPPAMEKADVLLPVIRIHSGQKWPARVVYDTSSPMPRPAAAANSDAENSTPPTMAVASPRLREAMAELRTTDVRPQPANPKKPQARLQRQRKFANRYTGRPVRLAAQRVPFGWFGPPIW
jgi:hypothetical protein